MKKLSGISLKGGIRKRARWGLNGYFLHKDREEMLKRKETTRNKKLLLKERGRGNGHSPLQRASEQAQWSY